MCDETADVRRKVFIAGSWPVYGGARQGDEETADVRRREVFIAGSWPVCVGQRQCDEETAGVRRRELFHCRKPAGVWRRKLCVERRQKKMCGGMNCFIVGSQRVCGRQVMCDEETADVRGKVFIAGSWLVFGGVRQCDEETADVWRGEVLQGVGQCSAARGSVMRRRPLCGGMMSLLQGVGRCAVAQGSVMMRQLMCGGERCLLQGVGRCGR